MVNELLLIQPELADDQSLFLAASSMGNHYIVSQFITMNAGNY